MSIRIYSREFGTGRVFLESGMDYCTVTNARFYMHEMAGKLASEHGCMVQEDSNRSLHVVKTVENQAVGRTFFLATSLLDIPLGHGWLIWAYNDDEVEFRAPKVGLVMTFEKYPEEEKDGLQEEYEFGGWYKPVLWAGNQQVSLDGAACQANAVAVLMMDSEKALWLAKYLEA